MVDPRLLGGLPLFASLPSDVLATLSRAAVERRFAPGEVLYSAGSTPSGLLVILDGTVRVVRGRNGRQFVMHPEHAGGALGEIPVFAGGTYPATAIAAAPTRCVLLPTASLLRACRQSAELALTFVRRLGQRTRLLVERVDRLAAQRVTGRLANFLLERQQAAGIHVPFTLARTQLELAEELGTVREVVVRALRQLRESGMIASAGRGRYVVQDLESLVLLANH
jgi:CRP-like cAMP-binding protein